MVAVTDNQNTVQTSPVSERYRWLIVPLIAFIITRLIVFGAAYISEIAFPSIVGDGLYHVNPNNIILDVWARWDSSFYLSIAENGYSYVVGQQSTVAFFPLYPLLMNLLAPLVGSTLLAGILISNAFLFGSLVLLYRLTAYEFDDETAGRAVFYIAAFPTAFFFSAVYTESTFLFFSVGSLYFARKRQWSWAVFFGLLCSMSRIVGVLSFGVIGLEWLRHHGWTFSAIYRADAWRNVLKALRTDWGNLLIIFIVPLGLISYMVFLYRSFGDPVAFSSVQSAWGREMIGPVAVLMRDARAFLTGNFLSGEIWYHIALDLLPTFAVLALLVWLWRNLGESYAILSALSVLIPLSSGSQSLSRYVLVVFPFFMALAYFGKHTILDRSLTILFSVFLGIFTGLFVNWIFIA